MMIKGTNLQYGVNKPQTSNAQFNEYRQYYNYVKQYHYTSNHTAIYKSMKEHILHLKIYTMLHVKFIQ